MLKTRAGDIIGTTPLLRYSDLKARKIVNNRATLANWIKNYGFPPEQNARAKYWHLDPGRDRRVLRQPPGRRSSC